MKIRFADIWDTEEIITMLDHYRQASPLVFHKESSEGAARKLLAQIFAGRGFVFLSEEEYGITGMLIAIKNANVWDEDALVINELAYWVEPDHRGTSAGYRLIKSYQEHCDQLKANGTVKAYTISKMSTSPDLKYDRFGFEKIEEMWSH
jgi:N-acetylglutamate synthase-like GNAT family acetyltransferase